ncbi:MAG: DNA polymerase III subunit beta [Bacilli bacterium]|nr:DNA polymerase III subunit beta [Bacilli bacterium]
MRFTIDKEQFLKGLLIAGRGISPKNAMPQLLCFKLEMTTIGLEITAFNGDVTVFTRVPLKLNEKEIIRNYSLGSSLINAHFLTEIVRKMEGSELSLDVIDESIAKIDDGNSVFKLPCMNSDEYPDIDLEKTGSTFSIGCTELTKLVEQTAFAALDKDTRPILNAINLKAEGGQFTALATDSARLSRKAVAIDSSIVFNANVSAKTITDIVKLFENNYEVEVCSTGEKMILSFGQTVVSTRLIGGEYPVKNSIIPQNFNYSLQINASQLLNAIDRVSILSSDRAAIVKLSMNSEGIEISSSGDQNGSGSEKLSTIQYQGERLEVAFNALFVSQAVKALGAEDVTLKFVGEMKPFVVLDPKDDSVVELITPMRTR